MFPSSHVAFSGDADVSAAAVPGPQINKRKHKDDEEDLKCDDRVVLNFDPMHKHVQYNGITGTISAMLKKHILVTLDCQIEEIQEGSVLRSKQVMVSRTNLKK